MAPDKINGKTRMLSAAVLLDTKMNGAHRFLSKKHRAKMKSLRHTLSPGRNNGWDRIDGLAMDPSGKRCGSHAPTVSSSAAASRSVSLASVSSEGSCESHLVEQEDIVVLTQEVRTFKEALGRLRRLIHPEKERSDNLRASAHDRLGEVLRILRIILERYPALQSTELLVAAGSLIHQVKEHNYEDEKCDVKEFLECIDQLALAFSSRVSEYLMGDLDSNVSLASSISSKTKSCENLPSDVESTGEFRDSKEAEVLTGSQIDAILVQLEQGVEVALHRAKLWSKYAKDIVTYVEKRCHLEMEFAKNVAKLAQTMRSTIKEESYLPFQSIYITALDQEIDNSTSTQMTSALITGPKFIEPLTARRNEHERHRKQIKETWQRELKRMQEAVSNLRKTRALYIQRQQDWERAKEAATRAETATDAAELSKVEKRKRLEDDALQKAVEAETAYKACVVEANERHSQLLRTKSQVLQQVRELMLQCDQTMKAVTVSYFQLQHTVSAPISVQFQTLCESSRLYEPGSQYMEFIKRMPVPNRSGRNSAAPGTAAPGPFTFEPYSEESAAATAALLDKDRKSNGSLSAETGETTSGKDRASSAPHMVPMKAWGSPTSAASSATHASSDTESVESNPSTKSRDNSPTASPMMPARRLVPASSGDELDNDQDNDGGYVSYGASRRQCLSKAAVTHTFRKLKTPSRCRECDSYVYFQGAECVECGLACHKKCLETLAIQCGHKRLPRKMTTFGVDLSQHLAETGACVPHLIAKCINEIDNRGTQIKGLYRVSGVKSKVEKLCQAFENGADLVDLTDVHPNVIANVLKLYLRQLPEPLLTSRLYPEFIRIAKDSSHTTVDELRDLCRKLPRNHYVTLAVLMHHLKRVSDESELNNMPSSNLGIVFGPTLLRTSEGSASLSSLVDTVHQTKVIELLITNAEEIFGPLDVFSLARENSNRVATKQEDGSLLAKVPVMRSLSFLEKHRKSRDSEVIVSTPADRRSEVREEVTLPGFVSDHKPTARYSEVDGATSTDDGGCNPTSDEDLPDFLLPDGSGKSGKLPHFRTGPAPKVFRGSLRDYHGLEGVNLNLLAAQEVDSHHVISRSRKTETTTQQSHSLFSTTSLTGSGESSLASVQSQSAGKVPFMDSSIDSDHSWESHSTGSSGRGTQQSDQGSLNSGPRSTHVMQLDHDEVDGPHDARVDAAPASLSSTSRPPDENRVKIQVPSGASLPPLTGEEASLAGMLNISRTSTVCSSESRGLVTVLEGPTSGTTLVESLGNQSQEQPKSLAVGTGNSSSSSSGVLSSLRSSGMAAASSTTRSSSSATNMSRTVLVSDLASLPAGLNHDFAHVFRSVRSVTTTTTTLGSNSTSSNSSSSTCSRKTSDRTPRFV